MVAAKRGAGMTDDRSGIVWALEHRLRGRHIWTPPHYEANPLWASQLPVLRYTDTVRHYSKRYKIPGEKINIRPKSSGSRRRASPLGIATHWYLCLYTPRYPTTPAEVVARTRTSFKTSGQIQNCPQNSAICTVNFQKCWSFHTEETLKDTRLGHNWRRAAVPVHRHPSSALERGHTARSLPRFKVSCDFVHV